MKTKKLNNSLSMTQHLVELEHQDAEFGSHLRVFLTAQLSASSSPSFSHL